jgi:hypothetical protein
MFAFEVSVPGLPVLEEEFLEHARDRSIYRAPLILCASGLRSNRIVAALCSDDVMYSRSQFGIPLGKHPPEIGHYLNGVLNSSLATYLAFLTASRWGIDKYVMERGDFLRVPIYALEHANARQIDRIRKLERKLRKKAANETYDEALVAELDEAVVSLYGLDRFERILVEDMVNCTIDLQRKHEKSQTLVPATARECREYAKHLIAVIQPFLETRRRRRLVADVLDVDGPLRVVRFKVVEASGTKRPSVSIRKAAELSDVLREVAVNLDEQIAREIRTRRHLRVYADDLFYIVKPSQRRFWTRSAGLVDGDAVIKDLLARDDSE